MYYMNVFYSLGQLVEDSIAVRGPVAAEARHVADLSALEALQFLQRQTGVVTRTWRPRVLLVNKTLCIW